MNGIKEPDEFPEINIREKQLPKMPLPTDTPEIGDVSVGARAIAAVTNRLHGSM